MVEGGKKNSQNRGKFIKPGSKKDFKPKRSSSSGSPKKHGKKPLEIKHFSAIVPGGIPGTGKPKFNRRPEKGWSSLGVPANRKPREGDKGYKNPGLNKNGHDNGADKPTTHRNYQRKRKTPCSDQKVDGGKIVSAKISGKVTSQINFAINKDSKKLNANPDSLEIEGENQFQIEEIDDGEPKKKKSKHKRIKITEQKNLGKKADLARLNADMCKFYSKQNLSALTTLEKDDISISEERGNCFFAEQGETVLDLLEKAGVGIKNEEEVRKGKKGKKYNLVSL